MFIYSPKSYSVSRATTLLARGITSKLVGKATANPINQPTKNLKTKPSVNPVFTIVIVKLMVVFKAIVIKNASSISEYFLPNFIKLTHSMKSLP